MFLSTGRDDVIEGVQGRDALFLVSSPLSSDFLSSIVHRFLPQLCSWAGSRRAD